MCVSVDMCAYIYMTYVCARFVCAHVCVSVSMYVCAVWACCYVCACTYVCICMCVLYLVIKAQGFIFINDF